MFKFLKSLFFKQPNLTINKLEFINGKKDDWVIHPNGTRVCQLACDIVRGQLTNSNIFYNVQKYELLPMSGQLIDTFDWLRRTPYWYGLQINIEGKGWVPKNNKCGK